MQQQGEETQPSRWRATLRRTVWYYLLAGVLWILLSDRLLALLVRNAEELALIQTAKGWLYILATAALLYRLLMGYANQIEATTEALAANEQQLERIVSSISDYVYVTELDEQGQWRKHYLSPHTMEITGYPIERFVESWEFWDSLIHPDDRPAARAQLARLEQGQSSEVEYRIRHADGDYRWIRDSARVEAPAHGAGHLVYGVISDVSAHKRAEQELRQSEARNRAIVNAIPDLIFLLSRDGVFLDYHVRAPDQLYLPREQELRGRTLADTLPADVADQAQRAVQQALATSAMQVFEYELPAEDGARSYEARLVVSGEDEVLTIVRDLTAEREAQATIHYQANFDSLTGLPNRRLFHERLALALQQASRHDQRLAVLVMDLDRFKVINDTLGHSVGDQLLRGAAQRLSEFSKALHTVARLSGDEFALILNQVSDEQQVIEVARRLLDLLAPPFHVAEPPLYVTPSIGISLYPTDGRDSETLLKNAEVAMYRVKEQGRNGYRFYSTLMDATSRETLALESSLRQAVEREEFVLHFQPVVELASWRVVGCEALVRWAHPERGLLLPGQWLRLAEETGLIAAVDAWVLRAACQQAQRWIEAGLRLRVAVNLSARQFQQDGVADEVADVLARSGLAPGNLELEITEDAIMQDVAKAASHLHHLTALGVSLAVDDFGMGYSSLSYLKRFPVTRLKIDRSFVRDVVSDPNDAAITRAIIALGHTLNLKVLAEGVESPEQLDFLRANHCDELQGYLCGAPLPPEEVEALLDTVPATRDE